MQYRREIDGLRAIAVLPIIFFHAGIESFAGGYVGVDVFFVISGYLITTIIINQLIQGHFSLAQFYENRARRIFPALFFVCICCIPPAFLLLPPIEYYDFARSLVATATFWSNFHFWNTSGYFDTAAELKPLLHTWSLAIEEQFYILYPLLLGLLWRVGWRATVLILGAVFVVSLGLAQWGAYSSPSGAYFLLYARAWELLLGAFAAFYQYHSAQASPRWMNELLSALGVTAIIYAVFTFDAATPFPSFYTLVPTIGTVLIILFARNGTVVYRALSLKALVWIGLLSYSLYLWHQPILAFSRAYYFGAMTDNTIAFAIGLTVIISMFSYFAVERPFRRGGSGMDLGHMAVVRLTVLASLLIVSLGTFLRNDVHFYARLTEIQKTFANYLAYDRSEEFLSGYRQPDCFFGSKGNESFSLFQEEKCLEVSDAKANVLLLGDSHAAHFWKALSHVLPEINILQATASGCRPTRPPTSSSSCEALLDFIFEDFLPSNRMDAIILSARWQDTDLAFIVDRLTVMEALTDQVIFFGPTVEFTTALPQILFRSSDVSAVDFNTFLVSDRVVLSTQLKSALRMTAVQYIPVIDYVCPQGECQALASDDVPMVWDYGHFTIDGAVKVVTAMREAGIFSSIVD